MPSPQLAYFFLYVCLFFHGDYTMGSAAHGIGALSQADGIRVPIYGSVFEYAYYFIDIYVGTSNPPQRQSVIFDTGSSLLAFPCTFCEECGSHLDPPFDMSLSPTATFVECDGRCPCDAKTNRCKYNVSYEEGSSINGYYIRDKVQLVMEETNHDPHVVPHVSSSQARPRRSLRAKTGELLSKYVSNTIGALRRRLSGLTSDDDAVVNSFPLGVAPVYIGCHKQETNLFLEQEASGVMGVSFRSIEEEPTVMNSLFKYSKTQRKTFSVCLSHFGGELAVGESFDGRERNITFAPMVGRTSYSIQVSSIELGGEDLIANAHSWSSRRRTAMIDTGTTYLLLPPSVVHRFLAVLQSHCKESLNCQGKWMHKRRQIADPTLENRCWKLPHVESLMTFPMLTLALGSADGSVSERQVLEIPPEAYLFPKMHTGVYCLGIREHPRDGIVLGSVALINKEVIFDLDNYRIGFADRKCASRESRIVETSGSTAGVSKSDGGPLTVLKTASAQSDEANSAPDAKNRSREGKGAVSGLLMPKNEAPSSPGSDIHGNRRVVVWIATMAACAAAGWVIIKYMQLKRFRRDGRGSHRPVPDEYSFY